MEQYGNEHAVHLCFLITDVTPLMVTPESVRPVGRNIGARLPVVVHYFL